MREILARNALGAEDLVSCIFTLTPDLDAEFPAVAAREMGLSTVPLLCAREIPVPGALPQGDPRADPRLHARRVASPSTSTSATRPSCGWTSGRPVAQRPIRW